MKSEPKKGKPSANRVYPDWAVWLQGVVAIEENL